MWTIHKLKCQIKVFSDFKSDHFEVIKSELANVYILQELFTKTRFPNNLFNFFQFARHIRRILSHSEQCWSWKGPEMVVKHAWGEHANELAAIWGNFYAVFYSNMECFLKILVGNSFVHFFLRDVSFGSFIFT